jgi:hypothetical protein
MFRRKRGQQVAVIRGDKAMASGIYPGHTDRYKMKDEKDKSAGQSGKPAKDPRRDRLKQALRENLKRRKSQARGRDDFTIASSDSDELSPHDRGDKNPGK